MKCSICKKQIEIEANGYEGGHNAFPLTDGRACDICNETEVVPMRAVFLRMGRPMPTESLTSVVKDQQKARAIANVSLKNIAKEVNQKKNNKGEK